MVSLVLIDLTCMHTFAQLVYMKTLHYNNLFTKIISTIFSTFYHIFYILDKKFLPSSFAAVTILLQRRHSHMLLLFSSFPSSQTDSSEDITIRFFIHFVRKFKIKQQRFLLQSFTRVSRLVTYPQTIHLSCISSFYVYTYNFYIH